MRLHNRHERLVAAGSERIAELVSDFDAIWPTEIAPVPRRVGNRLFAIPPMLWQEIDRQGSIRAFRVVSPVDLDAEHWFELEPVDEGTIVRHTVEGEALPTVEKAWRDRIEPIHDRILEALLDRIEHLAGQTAGGGLR